MSVGSADFFDRLVGKWVRITTPDKESHFGILAWFEPDRFATKDREGKETLWFTNSITSVEETPEPGVGWARSL